MSSNYAFIGSNVIPEDFVKIGHRYIMKCQDQNSLGGDEIDFEFSGSRNEHDEASQIDNHKPYRCSVCNHIIKNIIFFRNKQTKHIYSLGCDCAKSVLNFSFDVKTVKNRTLKQRKDDARKARIMDIYSKHPELEDFFTNINHKIVRDIGHRFMKNGYLSDKQIELVKKLSSERISYEKMSGEAPEGKFTGDFKIISYKFKNYTSAPSRYSTDTNNLTTLNLLLQHNDGWKLWFKVDTDLHDLGTSISIAEKSKFKILLDMIGVKYRVIKGATKSCSSSTYVDKDIYTEALDSIKGKTINVSTNISVGKDPYFAFAKRSFKINKIS